MFHSEGKLLHGCASLGLLRTATGWGGDVVTDVAGRYLLRLKADGDQVPMIYFSHVLQDGFIP